jgi:hypothetical protein
MLFSFAIILTFKTNGDKELGPREEKYATSGAINLPTTVLIDVNLTTGFLKDRKMR